LLSALLAALSGLLALLTWLLLLATALLATLPGLLVLLARLLLLAALLSALVALLVLLAALILVLVAIVVHGVPLRRDKPRTKATRQRYLRSWRHGDHRRANRQGLAHRRRALCDYGARLQKRPSIAKALGEELAMYKAEMAKQKVAA
jgi:hypothetical protein